MLPFVAEKHLKGNSDEERTEDNYEVAILVMAKKMGLTFEELNLLSLNDFFDYLSVYIRENETTRDATQDDIDNFYSRL